MLKAENQISTPKSVATVSESPKLTIGEQSNLGNETFSAPAFEPLERNQLLTELSQLTNESLESLRLNTNLASALDRYPRNIKEALQYFKQAVATWPKRPGIGAFISAVNLGQKLSSNQPGSEWGNWANEAERRNLLLYSQLCNEDILITFKNGVELLWSEIKSVSWPELEALVLDKC